MLCVVSIARDTTAMETSHTRVSSVPHHMGHAGRPWALDRRLLSVLTADLRGRESAVVMCPKL